MSDIASTTIAGNEIKAILASRGLTQEEAARRVGISYRHFNRIVLGHSAPSLLVAEKIARVLESSVGRLFSFDMSIPENAPRTRRPKRSPKHATARDRRRRTVSTRS